MDAWLDAQDIEELTKGELTKLVLELRREVDALRRDTTTKV